MFEGADAKYTVGMLINNARGPVEYKTRFKGGPMANFDCWEVLARHAQTELKIYNELAGDEKTAKVATQDEWNKYLEEENKRLIGLYAGSGEQLARQHRFTIMYYDTKAEYINAYYHYSTQSLKQAMTQMAKTTYNHFIAGQNKH